MSLLKKLVGKILLFYRKNDVDIWGRVVNKGRALE